MKVGDYIGYCFSTELSETVNGKMSTPVQHYHVFSFSLFFRFCAVR